MFWLGLAGPTASGKSALSMDWVARARKYGITLEIISVDSALVYRGMNIGSAKPSPQERADAPHHLIDIRDPLQAYSAAEFVADAKQAIQDIRARGAIPLLVGGTMLYFKALMDGLDDMPKADLVIRTALEAEAQAQGWPAMHAKLAAIDPPTAQRLSPNDSQRIQRALEVYRVSGKPMSAWHTDQQRAHAMPGTLISLEPTNRAWLHQRIAQRFDTMLDEGFMDEVRTLRARADLHSDLPSMRCVGYRQAWQHLDGETTFKAFREAGIAATRQLAKRQITWLRSMTERNVLACDAPDLMAQAWPVLEMYLTK